MYSDSLREEQGLRSVEMKKRQRCCSISHVKRELKNFMKMKMKVTLPSLHEELSIPLFSTLHACRLGGNQWTARSEPLQRSERVQYPLESATGSQHFTMHTWCVVQNKEPMSFEDRTKVYNGGVLKD